MVSKACKKIKYVHLLWKTLTALTFIHFASTASHCYQNSDPKGLLHLRTGLIYFSTIATESRSRSGKYSSFAHSYWRKITVKAGKVLCYMFFLAIFRGRSCTKPGKIQKELIWAHATTQQKRPVCN